MADCVYEKPMVLVNGDGDRFNEGEMDCVQCSHQPNASCQPQLNRSRYSAGPAELVLHNSLRIRKLVLNIETEPDDQHKINVGQSYRARMNLMT